jgi:hypothetical protein
MSRKLNLYLRKIFIPYRAITENDTIITLETLLPFRECMTPDQLERYGYYLSGELPDHLFTWEEIDQLRVIKKIRQSIPLVSDFKTGRLEE